MRGCLSCLTPSLTCRQVGPSSVTGPTPAGPPSAFLVASHFCITRLTCLAEPILCMRPPEATCQVTCPRFFYSWKSLLTSQAMSIPLRSLPEPQLSLCTQYQAPDQEPRDRSVRKYIARCCAVNLAKSMCQMIVGFSHIIPYTVDSRPGSPGGSGR